MRILAAMTASTIALAAISPEAHALCLGVEQEGSWVAHPTRGGIIVEAEIGFLCQDQIINGQPYPPGDPYTAHLWGDCSPTACDWGQVASSYDGTWYVSTYELGWATKTVWTKMSSAYAGELYVYVDTDFHDGRTDYVDAGYMIRRDESCIDSCGGYAGTCWCDASCAVYGDCCVDKIDWCD